MWLEQTHSDLKRHEGFREYAYPDPLSPLYRKYPAKLWGTKPASEIVKPGTNMRDGAPWTIGYGFTRGVEYTHRISRESADELLYEEIMEHVRRLDELVPDWRDMPVFASSTIANLIFNMGFRGLSQFKNTLKMFNARDYAGAGRNLKHSLWYSQVGRRAEELTTRLITGVIPDSFSVRENL